MTTNINDQECSSMKKSFCAAIILFALGDFSNVYANTGLQTPVIPTVNTKAYWVETNVCTVVLRVPIEINKALQPSTPIDQLTSLPAVCTSNVSGQTQVAGGVRSLTGLGYRVTGVSHQVTVLTTTPAERRVELLISAIFSLERPQVESNINIR